MEAWKQSIQGRLSPEPSRFHVRERFDVSPSIAGLQPPCQRKMPKPILLRLSSLPKDVVKRHQIIEDLQTRPGVKDIEVVPNCMGTRNDCALIRWQKDSEDTPRLLISTTPATIKMLQLIEWVTRTWCWIKTFGALHSFTNQLT